MENWSEDDQRAFIHHYQSLHFKENNSVGEVKCHLKRQSLMLLLQAAQKVTSNETTCHILKTKLHEYSAVVDKQETVNNYASGVLEQLSHSSNDAQKWTSKAKASDLIRDFLKPTENCYNKTPEGCSAQKPTKEEFEAFLKNKKQFPDNSIVSNIPLTIPKQFPRKSSWGPQPQNYNAASTSREVNTACKRPLEVSCKPTSKPESRPNSVMNMIDNKVFGAGNSNSNRQETKSKSVPLFRTAGTELKLQNVKKFGQHAQASGNDALSYGSNKKSLGGRTRSVNSKFVPPIKSNSQEDAGFEQNSCENELEDESLRLIDPKLVELIRSEIMDHGPPVGWDDIAGLHYAKATIQEIVVLPMLRPDIFTGLRRPPKGILLFGPPGTGKTLIGKCIASQSKSTFFNISASSLTSKWVGEGEKMVRTLFTLARIHQPAVVFIDEIDSLLSQRSETEHESSRRIKTEFLVQLDGAGTGEEDRVLVIGATNRPQELDEAARRRLVKRLYIPLPDSQARFQIVHNLMSSEKSMLTREQIEEIATLTEGYSGADMKTLSQEASLGPIRSISFTEMQHISPDQVRPVTIEDFKNAISRVKSSVSPKDLDAYLTWDQTYGSGGAPK